MLLQRVGFGPAAMTAREALEIATLGGAGVLGRDDIGALAPGMAADFVAFDSRASGSRARSDPVAALVFCAPPGVAWSVIDGRVVVREGGSRRWTCRRISSATTGSRGAGRAPRNNPLAFDPLPTIVTGAFS